MARDVILAWNKKPERRAPRLRHFPRHGGADRQVRHRPQMRARYLLYDLR